MLILATAARILLHVRQTSWSLVLAWKIMQRLIWFNVLSEILKLLRRHP